MPDLTTRLLTEIERREERRAYRCPCGGWHLTSKATRRARTA